MNQPGAAASPAESVGALRDRFEATNRAAEPVGWAVAAYRLGVATAEKPTGVPQENLRTALGLFEQASHVLTPARAPVEHARILNAAGSAHRMLGDLTKAIQLFDESAKLLAGRGSQAEEAAVLSNLGLALTQAGRPDDAIEAFARSSEVLPSETEEHIRTLVATKHNLAQAYASKGDQQGFEDAIATLEDAAEILQAIDAPLHMGMVWHSLGVTRKSMASVQPDHSQDYVDAAVDSFQRSLAVFTSVGFPFQHAIAKHNLGHALSTRSDLESLQRALLYYEDALNIFDPRLHRAHWQEAFTNAASLDARLVELDPDSTRADHTATLVGSMDEIERLAFLRQRLAQMERLPEKQRLERLTEFAYAVVTQPPASFVATLRTMISVLMELPDTMLQAALEAQLAAHAMQEAGDRRASDFILDEAINLLLFGPQRIRVRDTLADIGWERP